MMQMLAAGGLPAMTDGQRAPDDDNPRGYLELEAVKRTKQDPSWLNEADGKVVKLVHLLLYDLPAARQYRVVLMRRNITEVLASQRKMLDRHGKSGAAVPAEQLKTIFEGQLAKLTSWLQQQTNFSMIEIDYNALVADPRPHIAKLNAFLGGALDEAAMLAAVDPSLYRNRA